MKIIADLHIHSKYAMWCSNRLDIENIWKSCILKWIDLIWTWDFTHPKWFSEIVEYCEEDGKWFLLPKSKYIKKWIKEISEELSEDVISKLENQHYPKFVLQTEINSVFQRETKKSRIHNCILIDSIDSAKKILDYLSQFGNVESDWRLAVKQDQSETIKYIKENSLSSIIMPAHIWTPYFGVLWSRFGFESMKYAYWDSYYYIDAVETGLSSDPIMNWTNSEVDPFSIISNSDAHSPENFAREATIFEVEEWYSYDDLQRAIKSRKYDNFWDKISQIEKDYLDKLFSQDSKMSLWWTIEFYPQEWKYFWDGHKKCNFLTNPANTVNRNGKCPICGWNITIWVFHRSYNLANQDRIKQIWYWEKDFWTKDEVNQFAWKFDREQFYYIVPIRDIIYDVWGAKRTTKKAKNIYAELIKTFWSEFYILLDLDIKKAAKYDKLFAKTLEKVRNWDIYIRSGYDGVFGIVSINKLEKDYLDGTEDWIFTQDWLF